MKRPKSLAYQVWNMMRNDDTPDEKKFLGIAPHKIRVPNNQYVRYLDQKIQAKDVPIYA
jgi:hypothetical protein